MWYDHGIRQRKLTYKQDQKLIKQVVSELNLTPSSCWPVRFDEMDSISGVNPERRHVVAVPFPGRGHINPMINFCKLLVSNYPNITVTFVVTEEWRGLIGTTSKPPTMTFRSIPNVLPSELIRATVYNEFVEAVKTKMEAPVDQLLDRLESPVSAIIADIGLPWVLDIGTRKNIPAVSFFTQSPTVFSVFYHFDLLAQNGHNLVDVTERGDELVDYIPGVSPMCLTDLPSIIFSGSSNQLLDEIAEVFSRMKKAHCVVFTTFDELEHQTISNLKATIPCPLYTVGPLIPHTTLDPTPTTNMDDYFKWLDSQPTNSVLYVSLGSFLSLPREQMGEIVQGVHDSGVRFLWVARGDMKRIQEACGEMGLVVPWCDQLRVLCHSSVGGFLTHCGWNSTLEGVYAGVPMLTFPIIFDQIPNRKLIVDDWKVGMKVKEVATGEVVGREEIARIVQRFMDLDGVEGKEMRRKASELREICREALSKGGSSEANLDAFVREILSL